MFLLLGDLKEIEKMNFLAFRFDFSAPVTNEWIPVQNISPEIYFILYTEN